MPFHFFIQLSFLITIIIIIIIPIFICTPQQETILLTENGNNLLMTQLRNSSLLIATSKYFLMYTNRMIRLSQTEHTYSSLISHTSNLIELSNNNYVLVHGTKATILSPTTYATIDTITWNNNTCENNVFISASSNVNSFIISCISQSTGYISIFNNDGTLLTTTTVTNIENSIDCIAMDGLYLCGFKYRSTNDESIMLISGANDYPSSIYKLCDIKAKNSDSSMHMHSNSGYGVRLKRFGDYGFYYCGLKIFNDGIYLFCTSGAVENGNTIYKTSTLSNDGNYATLLNCNEITYVSISGVFSEYTTICKNNNNKIHYSQISTGSNGVMYFHYDHKELPSSNTYNNDGRQYSFEVDSKHFGYLYSSGSKLIAVFMYYPNCEDKIITGTGGTSGTFSLESNFVKGYPINNTLSSSDDFKVKFVFNDLYGRTNTSAVSITLNSSPIQEGNEYSKNAVFAYTLGTIKGTYRYTFSGYSYYNGELYGIKDCLLVFEITVTCYESCSVCNREGDSSNHNCISCNVNNGYFPLESEQTLTTAHNCYNTVTVPSKYYVDAEHHVCKPCATGCLTCSKGASGSNTNCDSCDTDEDYYPIEHQESICLLKGSDIKYYYFDLNTFKQCYTGCETCNMQKNDSSHNCRSCDSSLLVYDVKYYPTEIGVINDGMCFSTVTAPHDMFLRNNMFIQCNDACYSCDWKDVTTGVKTHCIDCNVDESYYPLYDNSSQCYHKDNNNVEHYYFDADTNTFQPCAVACLLCEQPATMENTHCTSCAVGYSAIEDQSGNCVKSDTQLDGYYNDNGVFKQCGTHCKVCSPSQTDATVITCSECYNGYKLSSTSQDQCEQMSTGYYKDENGQMQPCHSACLECTNATNEDCKRNSCNIANGYYPLDTVATTCIQNSTAFDMGYVLDTSNNYFKPCYMSCSKCFDDGNYQTHKCSECNLSLNYYPWSTDSTQCSSEATKPQNSYLDITAGVVQICYQSCLTCRQVGSDIMQAYCDSCYNQHGYYEIKLTSPHGDGAYGVLCLDHTTKNGDSSYDNYYFNEKNNCFLQCDDSCMKCEGKATQCLECDSGNGYYEKVEDDTASQTYKSCVTEAIANDGYYFGNDNKYHKCHSSCQTCDEGPDMVNHIHRCTSCRGPNGKEHPYVESNCVQECEDNNPFYIDVDNHNEYICSHDKTCPQDYPYLTHTTNECVQVCDSNLYTLNMNCVETCPDDTELDEATRTCMYTERCDKTEQFSSHLANTLEHYIDAYASEYIDTYFFTDKHVNIIYNKDEGYQVVIYKSEACAKEFIADLPELQLATCPMKLREHYNIADNVELTFLKMLRERAGQPRQMSYALYNSETGERLDLSVCEGETVEVMIPINQTEGVNVTQATMFAELGVDVFNSSDPFFNDICFTYTAENGRDVPLEERRKRFYQNVSFCEEGCEYHGVVLDTKEANCSCEIKTSFVSELMDNPLTGELMGLVNDANFEVVGCYKGVFNVKNISTNLGGWVIMVVAVMELPFFVFYLKNGLMNMKIYVVQYCGVFAPPVKQAQRNILQENNEENEDDNNIVQSAYTNKNGDELINNTEEVNESEERNEQQPQPQQQQQQRQKVMLMIMNKQCIDDVECIVEKPQMSKVNEAHLHKRNSNSSNKHIRNNSSKLNSSFEGSYISNNNIINEKASYPSQDMTIDSCEFKQRAIKDDEDFSDSELNSLDLYDAIIFDKRTFCQMYWKFLKDKQGIINAFFDFDPLEVLPIKAMSFFLSVILYFTLNAFFYTKSLITNEFNSNTPPDFLYLLQNQLTKCIYTTIVGLIVDSILGCITSSKGRIKSLIRREHNHNKFREDCLDIINSLKKKIIAFLIVNGVLTAFFWYYVSAFCYCYKNTQMNWFYGGLITLMVVLLLPFLVCFIGTVLRVFGLKCKFEAAYKLSVCLTEE